MTVPFVAHGSKPQNPLPGDAYFDAQSGTVLLYQGKMAGWVPMAQAPWPIHVKMWMKFNKS
jgi:hypothetical protein